jgi:single-stranded-DNA-specific exonuclease
MCYYGFMAKQWKIKDAVPAQILDQFPELSGLQTQLLYNLGLSDPDRVDWFLNPDYHNLYDPFLFTEMGVAVDRTWEAIMNKEKILVYGDYDADAVTACSILIQTFRYLGIEVDTYIPDRFSEGYGLNLEAFQKIKDQGVKVVITVDCGTNSVAEAEFCKANGIDLIITDHHEITGATPKAFALVNPKNPEEVYPDKQVTGAGVAYKFAKALLSNHENVIEQRGITPAEHIPEWDKWLLDLAAIGTVADCHSLLGENRILVSYGLIVLARTKWPGLRRLMETAGVDLRNKLDTYVLGFILAPRINAAGRIEHANGALSVLMAESEEEAIKQASNLEGVNKKRQESTLRVVSEAKEQAEKYLNRKLLLVSNSEWPKGLVGLAAGRLCEEYKKPAIVLSRGEVQ